MDKAHATTPFRERVNFFSEALRCWPWLLRRRPDLVHVVGRNYVTASAIAYAKLFNLPLVVELVNRYRDPHQSVPLPLRWLVGSRYPRRCVLVCISRFLADVCAEHGYADRIWYRPNPVDETRFNPAPERREALRRALCRFTPGDTLILNVAKFRPLKNQIFLLDVLRILPARFKLLCIGLLVENDPDFQSDRAYYREIQERIDAYGMQKRVELKPGFFNNVEAYMQMADVFAFPTTNEALGVPLLKALACALPPVATRIDGVTDVWIRDGVNGCLAELDAKTFADAILKASAIDMENRRRASRNILAAASTRVIDGQYRQVLQGLTAGEEVPSVLEKLSRQADE